MNILKRLGQIFLGFIATYFLADSIIRLVDEIKARQLMKEIDNIREEKKAEKVNEEQKEETTAKKPKYGTTINGATLRYTDAVYNNVYDYREDIKDIEATQAELFEYFGELDQRLKKIEDICNLISFNYSNHPEV